AGIAYVGLCQPAGGGGDGRRAPDRHPDQDRYPRLPGLALQMTAGMHPSNTSETPDLRIVRLDRLVEHEYNDEQRTTPLAQRLKVEGLLKNPPIVAPLEDGDDPRYVVLDGAN